MSVSYWLDNSKQNKTDCDIAIIGGGIAGLSTAYWLSKEDPSLSILVVEKNTIGYGATGRNAGFITCGSVEHFNRLVGTHGIDEAMSIWNFSAQNQNLLVKHIIKDNQDLEFDKRGSFSLAMQENEFEELKKSHDVMKENGIPVEILDGNAIKERLGSDKFVGGIKYLQDATINPIKLLNAIKDACGGNVKILENEELHTVKNEGGFKYLTTNNRVISCQAMVYATNGYSADVNDFFAQKIFPTRGQILVTEPVPKFLEGPCYANFVLDYFRQLPSGELLIGGFRQLQKDAEVGYSDHTTEVIQNALEQFLVDHFPQLKGSKITHRWSGVMGFSVDGQPMVGSLPTDLGAYFIGGFTAHGLGLAFHSAKVLVDLIFGREIPSFISASRFVK